MESFSQRHVLGFGAAGIALFLIGTSAPASAELNTYSVFGSQSLRYLIASAVLLSALAIIRRGRLPRLSLPDLGRLVLLATFGFAGFNVGLINATRSADPALVGTVLAATPVVLAVLGPLQRLRRPALRTVLGGLIVAIGTTVASGLGRAGATGIVWSLVALASEVVFSLLAVPLIGRYGSLTVTTYAGITSVPVLVVAGLVLDGPTALFRPLSGSELLALLYVALVVAVLANALWYAALSRLPADRAGLFYALTPVGALVGGLAVGRSEVSAATMTGLLAVMVGLVFGVWPARRAGGAAAVEDCGASSIEPEGGGRGGADPDREVERASARPASGRLAALSAEHDRGAGTVDLDVGRAARR